MAHAPHVQVRRVYDPPQPDDGQRVLVDRLWPRGLSKKRADLSEWCKDIAPSTDLRAAARMVAIHPRPLVSLRCGDADRLAGGG